MKKLLLKKIVAFVAVGFLLFISNGYAQVDKGVTSTGKEVDCSTINPSVDKTVSEYGKIVTHPRVTRNGKLITTECPTCGVELSITDTVTCVSITLNAAITAGTPTSALLKVYSDAAHTTQVGSDITATISGGEITAVASDLNCHTRYYFVLEATDASGICTFDWTDSTRDMTMEKVTTCTVASARALNGTSDLSHEHLYATGLIDSVYDHEGNAYAVVQIGNQCWLKENMRCTTAPPGGVSLVATNTSHSDLQTPRYYYPTETRTDTVQNGHHYTPEEYVSVYGYLYNFPGFMAINSAPTDHDSYASPHRGICPQGWHIPIDAEWNTLEKFVADNSTAITGTGSRGTGNPRLVAGCDWITVAGTSGKNRPGDYSYEERNLSGFSALPAGNFYGGFKEIGQRAYFACATPVNGSTEHTVLHAIFHTEQGFYRNTNNMRYAGRSVRCVRDKAITDTITFDSNNGNGVMPQQIVERGIKVALDSNEFTHNGTYAFIGWNTQRNGYGVAYADADSIVTNGNVTLYAQWHTYCSGNIRSNEAGSTRIDSVRDVDNNWYKVIEIGTQCWLAENLRVTHGKNTGAITQANTNTESATQPYYYDYASSDLTLRERGLLYNWSAAVDSTFDALSSESYTNRQGICPDGWHLPSDQEWFVMEKNTLIDDDGIWDTVTLAENSGTLEERDAHITGAGRWVTGDEDAWESDTHETSPGNFFYSERNMIGLNVIPTGDYKPSIHPEHGLTDDGIGANFWTSTTSTQGPRYAMGRDMDNFREAVLRHYYEKEFGCSIRCIRDLPLIPEMSVCEDTTFGTVTLREVTNVEKIEFIQNGSVVKTILNPDSAVFVNDLAQGTYKVKVTSSTEDTLVDNARVKHTYTHCTVGALRANEMGATTTQLDSVRDHQNNWYEVVQIGNQCWLKENMRCTTSPSTGSKIMMNKIFSYSSKSAAWYDNDSTKYSQYGVLYNWCAAVDTFYAANGEPELANHVDTIYWSCDLSTPRRGVCPEGWHVPTDDEWHVLELNVITDYDTHIDPYVGAFNGKRAGRLAVGCDWGPEGALTTAPGNYSYTERNLSGFSARPAGVYYQGFADFGWSAMFWSATNPTDMEAYSRTLFSDLEGVRRQSNGRQDGFSVRCVRDN